MWFIWIAIIFLVILGIVGTYFYYKKRSLYNKHKSIFEFWGIIIPILLAFLAFLQTQSAIKSSTKDFTDIVGRMDKIITKAEESSKSLHNVDESLSKLPQQMDSLSRSIVAFNDVISSQKEQLTITLNGLNGSILDFKSTVDTLVERFNRKPDLDIDLLSYLTDTTRVVNTIVVTNKGKLLADIYMIRFMIDTSSVISVNQAKETDHWEMFVNYQVDYLTPAPVYEADRIAKFNCNVVLKNSNISIFRVIVFYRASFGNDGTKKVVFVFHKDQDKYEKIYNDKDLLNLKNLLNH